MPESLTPQQIVDALGMGELDVEGGLFSQSWRDGRCSAIYYLLVAPDFSALHRLEHLEIYHYHAGAPAGFFLIDNGAVREPVLGPDLTAGQRPQLAVPAGVWQASRPLGEWSLTGTIVVPPYTDDCVEFADAQRLGATYPAHAARIRGWCR
jgi:predicted cupin superfamily sugar epimerase